MDGNIRNGFLMFCKCSPPSPTVARLDVYVYEVKATSSHKGAGNMLTHCHSFLSVCQGSFSAFSSNFSVNVFQKQTRRHVKLLGLLDVTKKDPTKGVSFFDHLFFLCQCCISLGVC